MPTPQAVTFHINAKSTESLKQAKFEIQKIIDRCYKEDTVKKDSIEFIEDDEIKKIQRSQNDFVVVDIGTYICIQRC